VVNRAARAQAPAAPGEILVTQALHERPALEISDAAGKGFALKGAASGPPDGPCFRIAEHGALRHYRPVTA